VATAFAQVSSTALGRLVAYLVSHGYCASDVSAQYAVTVAIRLVDEHRVCAAHWTRRTRTAAQRKTDHGILARVLGFGVSQATIARTLGVSRATVSRWHSQAHGISSDMVEVLQAWAATLAEDER
jgi:hypothetical protein